MAIDTSGLAARAAEILTDEDYDFWSAGFHERSIAEALCLVAKFKASELVKCIEYETTEGSGQLVPAELAERVVRVESNVGGKRIRYKSFDALSKLLPCYATDEFECGVEYYDDGCGDKRSFELYPAPPAGHKIRIGVVPALDTLTDDDLGCEFLTAILNWCLYRAFEREGAENGGKASFYRQAFYGVMGVFRELDQAEEDALLRAA